MSNLETNIGNGGPGKSIEIRLSFLTKLFVQVCWLMWPAKYLQDVLNGQHASQQQVSIHSKALPQRLPAATAQRLFEHD